MSQIRLNGSYEHKLFHSLTIDNIILNRIHLSRCPNQLEQQSNMQLYLQTCV